MKHSMIKFVDVALVVASVVVITVAFLTGLASGNPFMAILFGVLAFVGMAFSCGLWFCVSGIYHNTKIIADKMVE